MLPISNEELAEATDTGGNVIMTMTGTPTANETPVVMTPVNVTADPVFSKTGIAVVTFSILVAWLSM